MTDTIAKDGRGLPRGKLSREQSNELQMVVAHGEELTLEEVVTAFQALEDFREQLATALERLEAAEQGMRKLHDEAEEHRYRYDRKAQTATEGSNDYWRGRRDEAGYFRDLLAALARGEADDD